MSGMFPSLGARHSRGAIFPGTKKDARLEWRAPRIC
jgi:hypothetical protein